MNCDASALLTLIKAHAAETREPEALAAGLVRAVNAAFTKATWVGIYWLRGQELVLGPYEGPPTEHQRIPVGTGICGMAIAKDRDLRVDDVREVEEYLACSPTVRSEVVVLIRSGSKVVGQLDLDADEVGAFSDDDLCVLRAVADGLGGLIDSPPPPAGDNLDAE
jgi:GAF domain-containing protein